MKRNVRKHTLLHIRPMKTLISLHLRTDLSESLLFAWRNFASWAIQNAPSEDFDRTARKRRMIWFLLGAESPKVSSWRIWYKSRVNKELTITKTRLFKYTENFTTKKKKKWQISDKKIWYFSYFFSKHRLWVLVRTASARRFEQVPTICWGGSNEYPQSYVFEQK